MTDPDTLLQQAFAHHQTGALPIASALYRQVLELLPGNADALHLLGVAQAALGEADEGIALIRQAIVANPAFPPAYFNLGGLLLAQGRTEEALTTLMACIERAPDHAGALAGAGRALMALERAEEAMPCFIRALQIAADPVTWTDLGTALARCGRTDEALRTYEEAIRLRPDYAEAHYNRGCVLLVRQETDAAASAFEAALAIDPGHRPALFNLSIARRVQHRPDEALAVLNRLLALEPSHQGARAQRGALLAALERPAESIGDFDAVLAVQPDNTDILAGRGDALWLLGRLDEAALVLDHALALNPDHVGALVSRANVLQDLLRYEEALSLYDRALALRPDDLAALNNRGGTLRILRRHHEALDAHNRALVLDPAYADTEFNAALCLLDMGDWERGWRAFEARLRRPPWAGAMGTFTAPMWDGVADLRGKRVLLVGEQGLGDTIQCCRFARLVAARGATVILGVEPPLERLMAGVEGVAEVVIPGGEPPEYDLFCPLMSLPAKLKLTPADAEMHAPYLRADPDEVAAWRSRLERLPGRKVGLAWAGDPRPNDRMAVRMDRRRSIAMERLAPLLAVPGVTFISLQKGSASGQAAGRPIVDWTEKLHDFADTAALIEALDLVISVDTSVAHAAGAVGRTVWVLNRFDRCWRWMTDRTDTPWYPAMRLFTQTIPGDWESVVAEVAAALGRIA